MLTAGSQGREDILPWHWLGLPVCGKLKVDWPLYHALLFSNSIETHTFSLHSGGLFPPPHSHYGTVNLKDGLCLVD